MKPVYIGAIVLSSLGVLGSSAAAQTSAAAPATWRYEETSDPISDARRGIASLESKSGSVVIKCDVNGPGAVYIAAAPAGAYVGPSAGGRTIQLRFDDGAPRTDLWRYGGSLVMKPSRQSIEKAKQTVARITGKAPEMDTGADVDELAPLFAGAKKIVVRIIDYQGVPVDIVLTSGGDPAAVRKVYTACGDTWPGG